MISIRRNFLRTLAFGALWLMSANVDAGELLVMPYTCSVAGGQPQLTPSEDQGYSVVGHREEQDFTACSPANPTLCRRWKLYRFDIDCGGRRVPWASVAANARGDGRAWLEGGRLKIEMPPRWALAPDDICARESRRGYGWGGGGFTRFCNDRRARAQPAIVELPNGFAPMMGLDGIFVADGASKGTSLRVANADSVATSPLNATPAPAPHIAPPKPPSFAASPSLTKQGTQSPPATAATTKPAVTPPKAEAPAKIEPAKSADTAAVTSPSAPTLNADEPHLAVKPTIINQQAAAEPRKTSDLPTTNVATAEPAPAAVPTPPPGRLETASVTRPASEHSVWTLNELTAFHPLTVGAVSLAALAAMALTITQWRTRETFGLTSPRDIGALSLDRPLGRDLVVARTDPPTLQTQIPSLDPSGALSRVGNEIPQSREQALQILGMGVTASVSDVAIKKIVDGLRLSWHPDGATTDEERHLRELRTKQINAAWDIINGRRSA